MTKRSRRLIAGGGLSVAVLVAGIVGVSLVSAHSRQTDTLVSSVKTNRADAPTPSQSATPSAQPNQLAAASSTSTTTYSELPPDGQNISMTGLSAAVQAELSYVEQYWNSPNTSKYGFIDDYDCMNFASQALVARGWTQDSVWSSDADGTAADSTTAWRSSTAFMNYLEDHPEKATALSDAERSQVQVGDIVQFNWDGSGDRDHTGIVTRIDTDASGHISIYYAAHTDNTLTRSVDWAITVLHPGGTAYYWHLND